MDRNMNWMSKKKKSATYDEAFADGLKGVHEALAAEVML
jgi:hypothetical protein